jgi:diguanylate cyclase (GGDEF)-like protein
MPGFPTVNFSNSDKGLFTPEEIRRLMRIEFERAQRYEYPIVCMLIEVDRLESLHDLYGVESKEEILNSVIELLRSMTRSSDFLGCLREDRLMVTFPHTPREVANKLAERLIKGAHKLRFDSDGRTLRTTLSIGGSYCQDGERLTFDQFQQAAEDAVVLAHRGGGDRFVERARVLKSELQELREQIEARTGELRDELLKAARFPYPEAIPTLGQARSPLQEVELGGLPDTELGKKLRELFQQIGPQTPDTVSLQRAVIDLVLQNIELVRAEVTSGELEERNRQIDTLERRVRKLAGILELTENELRRVAAMKDVDPGISSIYRSVQGLSGAEQDYQLRRALMNEIFKANLELRDRRKSTQGSKPAI